MVAASYPASIASPSWSRSLDSQGRTISFIGQSAPVVLDQLVFAQGSVQVGQSRLFFLYAIDRYDGSIRWEASIPAPVLDSWSTPAIDAKRRRIIAATGNRLTCFDAVTGAQRWQTALTRNIVNASPCIAGDLFTSAGDSADRVFITDYDGATSGGRLYCINIADRSTSNLFDPGQIVWSAPLNGSSGNTPAYLDRRVYVSTAGNFFNGSPGEIRAYPADATTAPSPLWSTPDPAGNGFYAGVACAGAPGGGAVYAATYEFFAGADELASASLLKVDAATGAIRWSVPCPRTSTTPLPLGDGRILVSTGLNGFGAVPALVLYQDLQTSATLLWNSALATWTDANSNGVLDAGEYLSAGGWSNQPAAGRTRDAKVRVFAGVLPSASNAYAACTTLRAFDLDAPGGPSLAASYPAGGSSPALPGDNLYTISSAGLLAFGPPPPLADVNQDLRIDIDDLYAWEQGGGARDVNRDGVINDADRTALEREVRRGE